MIQLSSGTSYLGGFTCNLKAHILYKWRDVEGEETKFFEPSLCCMGGGREISVDGMGDIGEFIGGKVKHDFTTAHNVKDRDKILIRHGAGDKQIKIEIEVLKAPPYD